MHRPALWVPGALWALGPLGPGTLGTRAHFGSLGPWGPLGPWTLGPGTLGPRAHLGIWDLWDLGPWAYTTPYSGKWPWSWLVMRHASKEQRCDHWEDEEYEGCDGTTLPAVKAACLR